MYLVSLLLKRKRCVSIMFFGLCLEQEDVSCIPTVETKCRRLSYVLSTYCLLSFLVCLVGFLVVLQ